MNLSRPLFSLALLALSMGCARAPVDTQVAAPAASATPSPDATEPGYARGREYTRMFFAGQLDTLWARFSPPMRVAMKNDSASLQAFHRQVLGQLGPEVELVREESRDAGGSNTWYQRTVRLERAGARRFVVQWVTAADGTIGGFMIRPAPEAAPTPHLGYVTKTPLQLPFDGEWYVFWGGRTPEENYHVVSPAQRFAYDLVVRRDGRSHAGTGRALEDYHCFGLPILAPAAGTVAKAVDEHPDQAIGSADGRNPAGNHVVIDHRNGEFSTLAHLKRGSLTVKAGDTVDAGQPIGACGNSGNTSEPHLHYQLQDAADMFTPGTLGLPAQFIGYLADGKPVARGEPLRGQSIRKGQK